MLLLWLCISFRIRTLRDRSSGGGCGRGIVDVVLQTSGWTDRDDPRAELDTDGHIVVRDEAAFTESDGQLEQSAVSANGLRWSDRQGWIH